MKCKTIHIYTPGGGVPTMILFEGVNEGEAIVVGIESKGAKSFNTTTLELDGEIDMTAPKWIEARS
jgi:hypothetical protein